MLAARVPYPQVQLYSFAGLVRWRSSYLATLLPDQLIYKHMTTQTQSKGLAFTDLVHDTD